MLDGNWQQYYTSLFGWRDVQPVIKFTQLHTYDRIIVRGGPVSVTATFSYYDGTLTPGWYVEDELLYIEGTDKEGATEEDKDRERATDKFANIYTVHNVPDDWPGLTGNGTGYSRAERSACSPLLAVPGRASP